MRSVSDDGTALIFREGCCILYFCTYFFNTVNPFHRIDTRYLKIFNNHVLNS